MFRSILAKFVLKPRPVVTTWLEVAGFGLIVYGIWRISVTCGLIAAGCALILIGAFEA